MPDNCARKTNDNPLNRDDPFKLIVPMGITKFTILGFIFRSFNTLNITGIVDSLRKMALRLQPKCIELRSSSIQLTWTPIRNRPPKLAWFLRKIRTDSSGLLGNRGVELAPIDRILSHRCRRSSVSRFVVKLVSDQPQKWSYRRLCSQHIPECSWKRKSTVTFDKIRKLGI